MPVMFLPLLLLASLTSAVQVTITSYQTITTAGTTNTIYTTNTTPTSTSTSTSAPHLFVTSSTAISPQYTSDPAFQSAILNSTNTYRFQHNASALVWNDTLATYATTHASACTFAHTRGPYGENLAENYANVTAAVEGWGNERALYHFGSEGFSEQTGHFTQLVWKNTTSTGCGRMDCGEKGWLIFCEYWPSGNVGGEFAAEVQTAVRGFDESGLGRYLQGVHEKVSAAGGRTGERGWAVIVGLMVVAVVGRGDWW